LRHLKEALAHFSFQRALADFQQDLRGYFSRLVDS